MTRVDCSMEDAIVGTLLGTALGDALGLPCEGMGPEAIARRFGRLDRFHILGKTGFVSDDTEQSALVAQSILRSDDAAACTRAFRRSLLGCFLRLPRAPRYSVLGALLRNLALYPVVLAHGFRRLIPL